MFVGTVRKIELKDWVPTLTLSVDPQVQLPANATAKIGQSSILGTQHVELAAPAGTHPAIVRKLQAAINEVIKSPEYQASITKIGGEAKPGTSEDLAALIAADYKRWGEVAKAAGVSLD